MTGTAARVPMGEEDTEGGAAGMEAGLAGTEVPDIMDPVEFQRILLVTL